MAHLPRPITLAPAPPVTPNTHAPTTKLRRAVPVLILFLLFFFLALVCAPAFAQTATLSTTSLTFNNQAVGTTSDAKNVKVTNSGAATLTFSSIAASGEFAVDPSATTCGATVAPGKSCHAGLAFTPAAPGTRNGALTFTDNASGSPQTVSLTGTGIAAVVLSPSSWNFGNQGAGITSAAKAITLTNNLSTPLNITSIAASGDFAIASQTCGVGIAGGASCTINVTFTPTALGNRPGTLTITDNASASPQTAALSGTGVALLTLAPSKLSFGAQFVGTTSPSQAATLSNGTTVPVAITSIAASGDFTIQNHNCPATLAAGANCTINVVFSPQTAASRSGALTATDAAANSPQAIALAGIGKTSPVTLSPSSLTFGRQLVGSTSSAQTAIVTNTGNGNVTSILVVATGDFTQTNTCPNSLASGASCAITVKFAPTTIGTRTGAVTLTDSASTSPQLLSLRGLAYALSSITVTPANPSIQVGSTKQFTATGTYTDSTTQDLTSTATWSSSATSVATITATGFATGVGQGQTTIAATASVGGSTLLTVTAAADFVFTGSLNTAREYHTATLLNNGMVLLAGGFDSSGSLASAELYNPATGTFASTGSLNTARWAHTATLLNNGLVLIAGGFYSSGGYLVLASAELYNPTTGTFTSTGSLNTARYFHTATLLNNGMVLVAGGSATGISPSAELYNPAAGTFTFTGSLNTERADHTATLLNNGMVLLAGGQGGGCTVPYCYLASAELYNPATGTFTSTGSLNTARVVHTATLLNNGMVLLAGGYGYSGSLASAELYNPAAGTFASTGGLNTARYTHTATLLNNGMVLVAGGGGDSPAIFLSSAELY